MVKEIVKILKIKNQIKEANELSRGKERLDQKRTAFKGKKGNKDQLGSTKQDELAG